jgi:hypothetical protein
MTTATSNRRVKPTAETHFHIDYDWWARDERDLRVYLLSHLPSQQQELFANNGDEGMVDWIDPATAEVTRVNGLQMALQMAANNPDFITEQTSLVDAVFRVFLANNNAPLTPNEISEAIGRQPGMILKTIAGTRVYKGIRPVTE